MNNPLVCTVKDREYAEYFGFTKQEVKELLEAYGFVYDDAVRQMALPAHGVMATIWEELIFTLLVGRAQSLVDYQLCQSWGAYPLLGEYQFKQNDKISDAGLRSIFQRWI